MDSQLVDTRVAIFTQDVVPFPTIKSFNGEIVRKFLILIFGVTLLSSCALPPSQEEMATADYGLYPSDYERIIKDYAAITLKDPSSAQYTFLNEPKRAFNGIGGAKFGWVVCANINAKNSYGGYVGTRMNYFMIKDGRVINASYGDGGYGDAIVGGKCKGALN